jgi:hypothetical protein
MVITSKVAAILRQRYAECRAVSKMFHKHVHNVKDYVLYARVFWGVEGNEQCYHPHWLDSCTAEAIEGLQ